MNLNDVRPNMPVRVKTGDKLNSSATVGTVDHLDGEHYIKLKKKDSPDGHHHWIPLEWVEKVEGDAVLLSKSEEEFKKEQLNDNPLESQGMETMAGKDIGTFLTQTAGQIPA